MGRFIFFKKGHPDMQTLFHTLPRFFPALFSAFILLSVFVLPAHAQSGAFTITPATGWSYATNTLTITTNGTYTITMTAPGTTTTADRIAVASGVTADITLDGVNINVSTIYAACAFGMVGATVNLTLQGSNTLRSGGSRAGLEAPSGATLAIYGPGSLIATGGDWSGAGIGGGDGGSIGGDITIYGGTITATGGSAGAGIGGGMNGNGGNITIQGGAVTATGGANAAGIGGGFLGSSGGNITIDSGTITATGGYFGAGIGGGESGNGGNITIDGGVITATGGFAGAGIGGGIQGNGGNITLHDGTIAATGGSRSAGIGGGGQGNGVNITIDGGTITAMGGFGGAGIGGGFGNPNGGASGTITIADNADVIATGGNANSGVFVDSGGAGIGSGGSLTGVGNVGAVDTITVSTTGTVFATGGTSVIGRDGANIGQGGRGDGPGAGITSWTSPAAQTAVAGNTATFSVTTTLASGMPLPSLAYQWQESTNGGVTFGAVGGATLASYTTIPTTATMNGYQYRSVLTASNVNGNSTGIITITGFPATLTVFARNATVSVPTTSGGILIALGVLLAGLGAGALRRKFA
jgi:hypothetical protein